MAEMNVYVTRNVEVNNGNMRRPVEMRGVLLYDKEKSEFGKGRIFMINVEVLINTNGTKEEKENLEEWQKK